MSLSFAVLAGTLMRPFTPQGSPPPDQQPAREREDQQDQSEQDEEPDDGVYRKHRAILCPSPSQEGRPPCPSVG